MPPLAIPPEDTAKIPASDIAAPSPVGTGALTASEHEIKLKEDVPEEATEPEAEKKEVLTRGLSNDTLFGICDLVSIILF